MRWRVVLGRFLVYHLGLFVRRLGRLIQSLAVVVMRPDDLLEFNRRLYTETRTIDYWAHDLVDSGLSVEELALLSRTPVKEGKLLILGMGGGREAIHLSNLGFEVTGVDFIPEMVEKARENAARNGLHIKALVQDLLELEVTSGFYDIVWFSTSIYSFIPTRERRIQVLKKVRTALKPEGFSVCQFSFDTRDSPTRTSEVIRRLFAYVTLGNLQYEKGDTVSRTLGFAHFFRSEDELRSELEEGGFEVLHLLVFQGVHKGGAVLRLRR